MTGLRRGILLGWITAFMITAHAVFPQAPAPTPVDNPAVAEMLSRALTDASTSEFRRAWEAVLAVDKIDSTVWQTQATILRKLLVDLNRAARDAAESSNPQRGIDLAELIMSDPSQALVAKLYPQNLSQLRTEIDRTLGIANRESAERAVIQNRRDIAAEQFATAMRLLKPKEPGYAILAMQAADTSREMGATAFARKNNAAAQKLFERAIQFYKIAIEAEQDPKRRATAQATIEQITKDGLNPIKGIVIATPTPQPSPTPEPTMMDQVKGFKFGEAWAGFTKRAGRDPKMWYTLLFWVGLVVAAGAILWGIPRWYLNRQAHTGDFLAAEFLLKAKYLGIFALIGFFIQVTRNRKPKAKQVKAPCPQCGFDLENIEAYEDLVFSRCPKCKNAISPLFTLEAYMSTLAASMATDAEKVNLGHLSMQKYLKRDTVQMMTRAIITCAVRRRASDIHVEPDDKGLIIRQRIDGVMTEMIMLPRSLAQAVVSALKIAANLNIAEKRLPQDGKLQIRIDNTDIDVRIASSPASSGEKVSMRLLDIRSIQIEARHLGMHDHQQETFLKTIRAPHGLILVTGPTGSGKSTTLYVALQTLKTGDKNIISIEDPIEFQISGVNQIQVNVPAGLTFASCLRSVLRQDPDIIMVGEIRDQETAEISVNAASTGHLVLSTLHTIDACSSVSRLFDLGVAPRQFADALSLVVAQRLVRLVCSYCKEPVAIDWDVLGQLGISESTAHNMSFYKGKGCPACAKTGYLRRAGIFEFLSPTDRIRAEIEKNSLSTAQLRDLAIQNGMTTLRQEAIRLLLTGVTTIEETVRVTK